MCSARASRHPQSAWHRLADELDLGFSEEKCQLPLQRVTYTGMVVDTFHQTISIPSDESCLAEFLEGFSDQCEATITELTSLRGRVQHYLACLQHIQPFMALLSSIIGTEDDPDYERPVSLPPAVSYATAFIRGIFEEFPFRWRLPLVPRAQHPPRRLSGWGDWPLAYSCHHVGHLPTRLGHGPALLG